MYGATTCLSVGSLVVSKSVVASQLVRQLSEPERRARVPARVASGELVSMGMECDVSMGMELIALILHSSA